MPIRFNCIQCQAKVRLPDRSEGRSFHCPRCGHKQRVPSTKEPSVGSQTHSDGVGAYNPLDELAAALGGEPQSAPIGVTHPVGVAEVPSDDMGPPPPETPQTSEPPPPLEPEDPSWPGASSNWLGEETTQVKMSRPRPRPTPQPMVPSSTTGSSHHHRPGTGHSSASYASSGGHHAGVGTPHREVAVKPIVGQAIPLNNHDLPTTGRAGKVRTPEFTCLMLLAWLLRLLAMLSVGAAVKLMLLVKGLEEWSGAASLLVLFGGVTGAVVIWLLGEVAAAVRFIARR